MKFIAIHLLLICVISGCIPIHSSAPEAVNTDTPVILPTHTIISSSTPTPIAETPDLVLAITPTPIRFMTPGRQNIDDLLQANNGCRFPCWWGIIPGETSWESAKAFLDPMATRTTQWLSQSGETVVEMLFPLNPPQADASGFQQRFLINKGVVTEIRVKLPKTSPFYEPQKFLSEFGTPTKVYLGGTIEPDVHWQSFTIVFYYQELGIVALFDTGLQPIQYKSTIEICFSKAFYTEIHFWSPKNSFESRLQSILQQYGYPFYSVEAITNLSLDEFQKQFTKESSCLSTSPTIWPGHQ